MREGYHSPEEVSSALGLPLSQTPLGQLPLLTIQPPSWVFPNPNRSLGPTDLFLIRPLKPGILVMSILLRTCRLPSIERSLDTQDDFREYLALQVNFWAFHNSRKKGVAEKQVISTL